MKLSPASHRKSACMFFAVIFLALVWSNPATAENTPKVIENSVVKVFSTWRGPDLSKPWTKQASREVSGSGMVIEGRRILTNAHVVTYSSQVQIQGSGAGDKISATVEAIAPGIDLAVLKLADETFFDSHPALRRARVLPRIKDPVLVYGFPTGGAGLSITKGIVSRIEFTHYNFPISGLRVQIDAPINPGNSGGPAIVGDDVIGLAFSQLANAQNIGYIIPCEEIDLFLADVADGRYDGKRNLWDEFQTLENPGLRSFLKLDKSVRGIVVGEPASADPAYPLKRWDVVTKIGGTPVDDQGMVDAGANLRVRFNYLLQKIASDGTLSLTVWRAGKELAVTMPVPLKYPKLIPFLQGSYPAYFIYGPLVFSTASEDFISALTAGTAGPAMNVMLALTASPLATRRSERQAFDGEELVVVPATFFSHRLSNGYASPLGRVVKTINGIPIRNLLHLVQVLRDSNDEFIAIEFAGRAYGTLVLPRAEALAATDEILTDNGIRSQGSPDVLAVWSAPPVH